METTPYQFTITIITTIGMKDPAIPKQRFDL